MLQKTHEMDQGNCVTFAAALNSLILFINYIGKGKVFPLQARCGPEGG